MNVFGLKDITWSNMRKRLICTCGHNEEIRYRDRAELKELSAKCPSCGTTKKGHVGLSYIHYNQVEAVEKSDKAFTLKINREIYPLTVVGNKPSKKEYIFSYNSITGEATLLTNGKVSKSNDPKKLIGGALKGMWSSDFIDIVSTDTSRDYWTIATACFINVGEMLINLHRYPGIERLAFSPLGKHIAKELPSTIKSEFKRNISIFNINNNSLISDLGITKSHFKSMVRMLDKIRDENNDYGRQVHVSVFSVINYYKSMSTIAPPNIIEELFDISVQEGATSFLMDYRRQLVELARDYGYSNSLIQLFRYIVRDCKLQQGIEQPHTAYTLLRDYKRMSRDMERSSEKYPDSLKKVHDVTQMNYRVVEDKIKERSFKNVMNDRKELEHRSVSYSFVLPEKPKDLVKEGTSLHHCVASYVNDVIKRNCTIVFLRKNSDLDTPYATIEIRNNKVAQARGQYNKEVSDEERKVIARWATMKGIEAGVVTV